MTTAEWAFPWRPAVAGALIFALLRMSAHQVTGAGISMGSVALSLFLGAVTAVALALIVAPAGQPASRGGAMRRALLFCVVPCAAVAGGVSAGDVDGTRAVVGILFLVAGSLAMAWLTTSGRFARR